MTFITNKQRIISIALSGVILSAFGCGKEQASGLSTMASTEHSSATHKPEAQEVKVDILVKDDTSERSGANLSTHQAPMLDGLGAGVPAGAAATMGAASTALPGVAGVPGVAGLPAVAGFPAVGAYPVGVPFYWALGGPFFPGWFGFGDDGGDEGDDDFRRNDDDGDDGDDNGCRGDDKNCRRGNDNHSAL